MTTFFNLESDAEQLANAPRDSAGRLILRLHQARLETHQSPILHTEVVARSDTLGPYLQDRHREIATAIRSGFSWLVREGYIVPTENGWHELTKDGRAFAASTAPANAPSLALPREHIHPDVYAACSTLFAHREYSSAVFEAFKRLEIAIRSAGGYEDRLVGSDLARKAFNVENGPLSDMARTRGEREALSNLVAGALGYHKNPLSHRAIEVAMGDAFDMITLASYLRKLVDKQLEEASNH